jgi:AraC-like DNA-binding protein
MFRCTQGTRLEYFAHRHREIELIIMLNGFSTAIVDGVSYHIEKGDALIIFPNHLHKFISTVEEDYILLLIPSNIYNDYGKSIDGKRPVSPLIKNGAQNDTLITLAKICMESKNLYAYQCRKFLIGAILGVILNDVELVSAHTNDNALNRILDYCEEHYKENITLEQISIHMFLSKYYISHLFSDQLGVSLTHYINSLRIEETVKLLTTTEIPITDICFSVGFSSIRTFNRVFFDRIGTSPKEYRKNQHKTPGSCVYTI